MDSVLESVKQEGGGARQAGLQETLLPDQTGALCLEQGAGETPNTYDFPGIIP